MRGIEEGEAMGPVGPIRLPPVIKPPPQPEQGIPRTSLQTAIREWREQNPLAAVGMTDEDIRIYLVGGAKTRWGLPAPEGYELPGYPPITPYERETLDQNALNAAALATYRIAQLQGQEAERIATAAWRQAQEKRLWAQMGQTGGYNQAQLAQRRAEAEMQRQAAAAQLGQRQREMGADIGMGLAQTQAQTWAQGLPYQLPKGTMFAPGFGPGGPVSEMARRAGVRYTPPRIPEAPPPSRKEMEQWIQDAIAKFGG